MKDIERFDKIFNSNKYSKSLTDIDFLRLAFECEKLFNYLQHKGILLNELSDIKKYMHFAFFLGMVEKGNYKIN